MTMIATGPLEGIRVMDFGWVVAGPRCGKTLADLGAEVIRIEGRSRIDSFRHAAGFVDGKEMTAGGRFKEVNRNKLAITLNMRDPRGLAVAKRLLAISDVVIENFTAGVMDRWGFGYDVMREINPGIVYISMSGYGHSGPYKTYVSHGPILQALAGYTHCTGLPDRPPVVMGAYADFIGGASGALAVVAALASREQTGHGQYIDLGQYQAITATTGTAVLDYTVNGRAAQRIGNGSYHQQAAPYGPYRCAGDDRWCVIAVTTADEWTAFCWGIGDPAWTLEPRFSTMAERVRHRQALDEMVTDWTRRHQAEEVMHRLQKAGCPSAVVQNAADMTRDPHLNARGFWEYQQDPELGTVRFEGVPPKLSETPGRVRRPAPLIGQHNDYVYGKLLGMGEHQIQQYADEGVF
ncbi:MAG: CoA transferase [Chloroflexi bacterium]|nr:CoA transferase [Chloroflexota bacterium]